MVQVNVEKRIHNPIILQTSFENLDEVLVTLSVVDGLTRQDDVIPAVTRQRRSQPLSSPLPVQMTNRHSSRWSNTVDQSPAMKRHFAYTFSLMLSKALGIVTSSSTCLFCKCKTMWQQFRLKQKERKKRCSHNPENERWHLGCTQ